MLTKIGNTSKETTAITTAIQVLIAENSTDEGRARNRREEIKIYNLLSASY